MNKQRRIPFVMHATVYRSREMLKYASEQCDPQATIPRHVINIAEEDLLSPDKGQHDSLRLPDGYPCQCGEKNSGIMIAEI